MSEREERWEERKSEERKRRKKKDERQRMKKCWRRVDARGRETMEGKTKSVEKENKKEEGECRKRKKK